MLAIDGEEAAPPATDNTRTTSQYAHRRGTSKINAYSYILDGTSNFEQRTECYADTALFGGADEIRLGPTLMRSKPQMECIGVTPRAEAAKDFGCHMLPACDLLPYIDGGAIQCSIFDQSRQHLGGESRGHQRGRSQRTSQRISQHGGGTKETQAPTGTNYLCQAGDMRHPFRRQHSERWHG